jgi:microcystin synthetase protein McyJ
MLSRQAEVIAKFYTERHAMRQGIFGDRPFANYGYWSRDGMTFADASEALTELVARESGMGPGDRVLEVGCGYGASAVYYVQRFQPAHVHGLDVTAVRIQTGQEYVARHGLQDRITLQLGDATALPFEATSFDRVLAIECAFLFDTREAFFREAGRVLGPGGVLALTDLLPRPDVDPEQTLYRDLPFGAQTQVYLPANVYHADVYRDHLHRAGFADVRIDTITAQTRARFVEELARLAARTPGEQGEKLLAVAQRNRDHIAAGAEYVLVVARKGKGGSTP